MRCRTCQTDKSADAFYSSNRRQCKECVKSAVRRNREKRLTYYREYDRKRANRKDRVEARKVYQATDRGRAAGNKAKRRYSERNPAKRRATVDLSNAVRDGRVTPKPCLVCGSPNADGHHHDYSKPLDVIWLCRHHHAAYHKVEREVLRRKTA